MIENQLLHGNSFTVLDTLAPGKVHACITSPPYYALRDYKGPPTHWPEITYSLLGFEVTIPAMECQLGLEATPQQYIGHLIAIFRKVGTALRNDGTLWINIGDSYARPARNRTIKQAIAKSTLKGGLKTQLESLKQNSKISGNLKAGDLIGTPWMLAFAMRDEGWYLIQDIIWSKPNPMPESVKKRFTKSHEHFFLFSKKKNYYFDQKSILKPIAQSTRNDKRLYDASYTAPQLFNDYLSDRGRGNVLLARSSWNGSSFKKGKTAEVMNEYRDGITAHAYRTSGNKSRKSGAERDCPADSGSNVQSHVPWEGDLANPRDVWTIAPSQYKDSHFAVFPPALIVDPIKAGCPKGGIVLDPFSGSGTTAEVCARLERNFIIIDQNKKYIAMQKQRLHKAMGMFNPLNHATQKP